MTHNVHDLRILLGADGIFRTKISIHTQNNQIVISYHIPKTDTYISEVIDTHQLQQVLERMNIRRCIFNKAYEKSISTQQSIWLYSTNPKPTQ